MNDNKYNGWTNYETWRVNLEIFDGMDASDFSAEELPASEFTEILKDYVKEILCQDCDPSRLAHSYAMAFINEVNWYEIAKHMIDSYEEA